MEKLKKARSTHRTLFSKTLGVLTTELEKEVPNQTVAESTLAVLGNRIREIDAIDKDIFDALLDADKSDAELNTEMEGAEEYKQKYELVRVKVARLSMKKAPAPNLRTNGTAPVTGNGEAGDADNSSRKFKLPKIEIKKFNGDTKEWLKFWSSYKKVHDDKDISMEDKFDFLQQSMIENSRACEYVHSFPPTAENYPKVIKGLENRFSRKDLLVEVYMRELLKLVLNKSECTLVSVYDKLETQLRSLESLGVKTDTCAAMLFPLVESSLPEEILRVWQRKSDSGADARARLESIMDFLEEEVQNEERIQIAKKGFESAEKTREQTEPSIDKTGKKFKPHAKGNSVATAAGLLSMKDTNASAATTCVFLSGTT